MSGTGCSARRHHRARARALWPTSARPRAPSCSPSLDDVARSIRRARSCSTRPTGVGVAEPRVPTPAGLRDPAALAGRVPRTHRRGVERPRDRCGRGAAARGRRPGRRPDATMAFPEVGAGELPCWGGTQRLTRAGGVALALRMLVVGDAVDADVLERSGLACPCRRPARLRRASSPSGSRPARRVRKRPHARRCSAGRDLTMADGHRLESDLNLLLSTTDDRAEGIAAFFEKRAPEFEGE